MNVKGSFSNALDSVIGFLPNLIGFLLLLIVGYVIAKVISSVVVKLLQKGGLDKHLHESDANKYVEKVLPGASPSKGIGRVVFFLIFVFFLTSAIGALKIPAVTTFMNQVLAYLPNVIVTIAFAATMGTLALALALGLALAFGLGGRGVAERLLEDAYRKGQENKQEVKQDVATGQDRVQDQATRTHEQF